MTDFLEKISYAIKLATDLLFVKNPLATSMGVFFGVFAHGVVSLLSPFSDIASKIANSSVNIAHYIAGGVFAFNIRSFVNKDQVPEQIKNGIDFIRQQEREGIITKTEAKQKYRILIERYIESVTLDTLTAARVASITDTLNK